MHLPSGGKAGGRKLINFRPGDGESGYFKQFQCVSRSHRSHGEIKVRNDGQGKHCESCPEITTCSHISNFGELIQPSRTLNLQFLNPLKTLKVTLKKLHDKNRLRFNLYSLV